MGIIPGEPQLSLPLAPGLGDHEPCTTECLYVWPIRGGLGGRGPTENEPVSLKLIGCLARVSWRGSGTEGSRLLPPCGFHYPAGLLALEQGQRQGTGYTRENKDQCDG